MASEANSTLWEHKPLLRKGNREKATSKYGCNGKAVAKDSEAGYAVDDQGTAFMVQVGVDAVKYENHKNTPPMGTGIAAAYVKLLKSLTAVSFNVKSGNGANPVLSATEEAKNETAVTSKKDLPKKVGPLIRSSVLCFSERCNAKMQLVLNAFLRSFGKLYSCCCAPNIKELVDNTLNDLPRPTKSEPTAALLPELLDWDIVG